MAVNRKRGFATMDPEKLRAIASKGGKAAHAKGSAHQFTSEEAKEAGRKGGRAGHKRAKQESNPNLSMESGHLVGTYPYPAEAGPDVSTEKTAEPASPNNEHPRNNPEENTDVNFGKREAIASPMGS
jgi:hypothetical protein